MRNQKKDPKGNFIPIPKPGFNPAFEKMPELPEHTLGMVYLLAPILWLVHGTDWVEPVALICANLFLIASAFFFRKIVLRYTKDPFAANLTVLLVYLGSPLWAYGRTLFNEPFLAFFTVTSYYMALEKKSGLWAGILLGVGALLKPYMVLLLLPLVILWLAQKNVKRIVLLGIGPFMALAAAMYQNAEIYGSPFTQGLVFKTSNPLVGIAGLLVSWDHGILAFSPIALLALFAWKRFYRENGLETTVFAGGFVLFLFFICFFNDWGGGWCYGPRYMVPVLPFLMLPLLYLPEITVRAIKPNVS